MPEDTQDSPPKKRKAHSEHDSPERKKTKKSSKVDADFEGEFHVINASLTLSVPPVFANNPRAGVEEMLDSMVMRYIPAFRGVVLAHTDLSFTDTRATIKADCPFLVCDIAFDATVWCPKVGMQLVGRVNLCSPDHISLLIHKTFNASIPRHHIPVADWVFQYGPAENDPEFGPEAPKDEGSEEKSEASEQENTGKWINQHTGEKIGGEHGHLRFTVIGLTVANEMLSLQGSIQTDPFSPRHVARMIDTPQRVEYTQTDGDNILEEDSEDDEGSDADAFKLLSKQAAQAAAADRQKRQREDVQSHTEVVSKKKRRKGEKVEGDTAKKKRTKTKQTVA